MLKDLKFVKEVAKIPLLIEEINPVLNESIMAGSNILSISVNSYEPLREILFN